MLRDAQPLGCARHIIDIPSLRWGDSEAVYLRRVVAFMLGGILICSTLVVADTSDLTSSAEGLLATTQAISDSNDAGSGTDASDVRTAPTRLAGPGPYEGSLATRSDVDWFGLAPSSADLCVEATASGSATTEVTLDLPGVSAVHTHTHKGKDSAVDMALAGAGASDVRFGFTRSSNSDRAPGEYTFDLQAIPADALLADGDAGSGGDAGATMATAISPQAGCSGGTLTDGDTADLYELEAAAREAVTLSLAHVSGQGDLRLDLLDATGRTLETVGHNDVETYVFESSGTYYLKVHDTGDEAIDSLASRLPTMDDPFGDRSNEDGYLFGLDGPEPPSCSPSC